MSDPGPDPGPPTPTPAPPTPGIPDPIPGSPPVDPAPLTLRRRPRPSALTRRLLILE
jgi:hypothetical protein